MGGVGYSVTYGVYSACILYDQWYLGAIVWQSGWYPVEHRSTNIIHFITRGCIP